MKMKRLIVTLRAIGVILIASGAFAQLLADSGNVFITNDATKPVPVTTVGALPSGSNPKTGASGNVANASAVATLAAVSGRTNYITGFQVTSAGATGPLAVNVTVTGLITGTATYTFVHGTVPALTTLIVPFDRPIPASATNTAITVTLPASGAGGLNAAACVQGFDL